MSLISPIKAATAVQPPRNERRDVAVPSPSDRKRERALAALEGMYAYYTREA